MNEQKTTPHVTVKTVGIIGFGRFGRLLAQGLAQDFELRVYDSNPEAAQLHTHFHSLNEVASSDAVFLCVPIIAFEETVRAIAPFLRSGTLVLDVCSVKLFPEQVMKSLLPEDVYILPTHPMFGPDSAKHGWTGLPFVLCPVEQSLVLGHSSLVLGKEASKREAHNARYQQLCAFWREYLAERKQCKVVEMSSEEHDRTTAYTLCLTQLLGRALGNIGIKPSAIDAQSFKYLLQMKEISYNDSMDLLIGLHTYNPFAAAMRQRLRGELEALEPYFKQPER